MNKHGELVIIFVYLATVLLVGSMSYEKGTEVLPEKLDIIVISGTGSGKCSKAKYWEIPDVVIKSIWSEQLYKCE